MSSWQTHPDREVAESWLTPRQLEIWKLRQLEWSIRQIGFATGTSTSTVRSTLERIDQIISLRRKDTVT